MHYDKAPITEALIDFRVVSKPGTSAVDIAAGLATIREQYPERQEIPAEQQLQLTFGPHLPTSVTLGPVLSGFRYIRPDKRRVLQTHVEGFTFSLLPPYGHWDAFRTEARDLWEIYRAACRPLQVTRVAVRYVNRFDLPGPQLELKDYFNVYVQEPLSLKHNDIVGYRSQLVMPQPDILGAVVLNLALTPSLTAGTLTMMTQSGGTWNNFTFGRTKSSRLA